MNFQPRFAEIACCEQIFVEYEYVFLIDVSTYVPILQSDAYYYESSVLLVVGEPVPSSPVPHRIVVIVLVSWCSAIVVRSAVGNVVPVRISWDLDVVESLILAASGATSWLKGLTIGGGSL